jgi:glycosyltransferase involved in cell wall biosynthesis
MRVLMLTDLYPPYIGGIEQHVRNISRALVLRGHQVSVVTMTGPGLPSFEVDDGVPVHRVRGTAQRAAQILNPSGRPYAPPFPDPELVRALRRVVARERPQIVHAHNWLERSFLHSKVRSRAKLVVTLHDYGNVCAKRSFMYRDSACTGPGFGKCLRCAAANYGVGRGTLITLGNWATQGAQRAAVDMYLPVSNAVARGTELAAYSLPYEVLPNFVPDDVASRSDPAHPSLAELPAKPYWLYVGALSGHKGVPVLLEAYEGLSDAPPLVLIGPTWHDTPRRFPPNTVVLRSLPHSAVMAAWQRADLGLVPSVFPDPCPTVAMEAMASGVPLIASRIGGLLDIVGEGTTGLLVRPGDAVELRRAMRRMTADAELAQRMGEAAKRKVASFMQSAVTSRLEAIYSELLAEPG